MIEMLPLEMATVYDGFDILEPTLENPVRKYVPRAKQQFFMDPVSAQYKPGFLKQTVNFIETCVLQMRLNTVGADLPSTLKVTELCQQIMVGHV